MLSAFPSSTALLAYIHVYLLAAFFCPVFSAALLYIWACYCHLVISWLFKTPQGTFKSGFHTSTYKHEFVTSQPEANHGPICSLNKCDVEIFRWGGRHLVSSKNKMKNIHIFLNTAFYFNQGKWVNGNVRNLTIKCNFLVGKKCVFRGSLRLSAERQQ